MNNQHLHFESLQVHAGYDPGNETRACAVPVYQTTSFVFNSAEHAAGLFDLELEGDIYSRISNPTVGVFEKRMAALEGGTGALALSSGHAAQFIALNNLLMPGDNFISSPHLYGGSYNQFKVSFRNLGIEVRFAASQNPEDYRLLIDEKTRAIYTETIGNPGFTIPDFDGLSRLCTDNGIPLIVDNTFAGGGYLCRPIKYGANIVVESATKWIGGHGTSMGGVIIDGGNFNWANGKFPQFTEPSQAYHGLVYTKKFTETKAGNVAFITRARAEGLRDFGPCMSPFNAFQLLTGLETLSLRMQRHCENAKSLALWLAARQEVEDVNYPGLESSQGYANAVRYLRNGFGGVLSVTLKGGRKQACKLVESLKMIRHLANVGDVRTLIIQPASTTHRQLSEDELLNAGINPGLLRISAGIEHIDDIIHDFQQALERCG